MQKLSTKEETKTFSISVPGDDYRFILKECRESDDEKKDKRKRQDYIRKLIADKRKCRTTKGFVAFLKEAIADMPYDDLHVIRNGIDEVILSHHKEIELKKGV